MPPEGGREAGAWEAWQQQPWGLGLIPPEMGTEATSKDPFVKDRWDT